MRLLSYITFLITLIPVLISCNQQNHNSQVQRVVKIQRPRSDKYDSTVFENLYNKLYFHQNLSKAEIDSFTINSDTRAEFYDLLEEFKREDIFPPEFNTFEKAAESRLTNWLEYPTELDTIPSQLELLKKVNLIDSGVTYTYYAFRFKTEQPHWAAKDGWMIGVVGPYLKDSKPYDWTGGTFSNFKKEKQITPEKEAEWAHKNVFKRSPE
ncbi:hypothetical protein [Flavisolibacter ginsenosidimutans]|uniref:Uncharacterized protein n=1 Tax=Flavisolibacter ginsenosidimutans TaxID=661481 RepID=A0A5B8UEB5_9BACT|nr:hypothetical protein [Flavisolibacter ginsenosidimutans]QEC54646.1 hypothetical protein FSB75_01600 [Flavisolibacter ginsenosidimutans]